MSDVSPEFYWSALALVTVLSVSRLIRLWTYDDFPPLRWANDKFAAFCDRRAPKWAELGFCPWCVGFWITLVVVGWGWLAGVYDSQPAFGWTGELSQPIWWLFNASLAVSYVAAMIMVRDGDTTKDA